MKSFHRFVVQAALVGVILFLLQGIVVAQPSNTIRYAKSNKTPVRCGPGADFYETSHLKQGAVVEVYHRSKDGWCAIRPPEGSFCWLSASNAYLLPGGTTAEVVGTKVPAWIGTNLNSPKQLRWQLELEPSQQVRVLGEAKQKIDDETERLWYRIAPPQGEFRWIREKDLSEQPPIADPNVAPLQESKPAEQLAAKNSPKSKISQATSTEVQKEVLQASATASQQNVIAKDGVKSQATSKKSNSMNTGKQSQVTQAQHVESLPPPAGSGYQLAEGEYIVGSEKVVSDHVIGESPEGMQPEMIVDGDEVDSGEYGEYIEEEGEVVGPDPGSQFHLAHGEDPSMDEWSAINARPGRVLVKPLNGILGLIGLGVAEAEIVEPDNAFADQSLLGRFGARSSRSSNLPTLDHLPRPVRRGHGRSVRSLLQGTQSEIQGLSDPNDFGSYRSSRGGSPVGTGINAPEPLNIDSNVPSLTNTGDWHASNGRPGSLQQFQGVSTASTSDLSPMQLTTPELQEAFLELTHIVSKPTEDWDLRQVHAFASQWVDRGTNAIERGEARLLLDRILQFEALRQKMPNGAPQGVALASGVSMPTAVSTAYGNGSSTNANMTASWTPKEADVELPIGSAAQADASGWLMPVHSPTPGQPDFALADSTGNVIAYVIPSPGLNLRRYSKQMVGIYGSKGYLPELRTRQIVAERIVRLK